MGHHKDIRKNIYRLPIPVSEITDASRLLMAAIGDDEKDDQDKSEMKNSDSDEEHVTSPIFDKFNSSVGIDHHSNANTSRNTSSETTTGVKRRSSKVFLF